MNQGGKVWDDISVLVFDDFGNSRVLWLYQTPSVKKLFQIMIIEKKNMEICHGQYTLNSSKILCHVSFILSHKIGV